MRPAHATDWLSVTVGWTAGWELSPSASPRWFILAVNCSQAEQPKFKPPTNNDAENVTALLPSLTFTQYQFYFHSAKQKKPNKKTHTQLTVARAVKIEWNIVNWNWLFFWLFPLWGWLVLFLTQEIYCNFAIKASHCGLMSRWDQAEKTAATCLSYVLPYSRHIELAQHKENFHGHLTYCIF